MVLINGKSISEEISVELSKEIDELSAKGIIPSISIIQIGDNQASSVYVRNKLRLCEKLHVNGSLIKLPETTTQSELIELINKLNNDASVNGILLQLPIPQHIDENAILSLINPIKDVDCFNISNVGALWSAKKKYNGILPCTPLGCIELLKHSNIDIAGKNVVIIGRSNIVGKPLAALFLLEDATPTICHSKTANLSSICANADILVAAIGKAKFVTRDFVNSNSVIIDVGINRDENGKLCGDVDFENVKDCVKAITPVPGGCGPMTIVMLMRNLINATKIQHGIN